jgi:hypothetical protein
MNTLFTTTTKLYAIYYKGQPGMYDPGFCLDASGIPTLFTKEKGLVVTRHDPLYELKEVVSIQIQFVD